MYDGWLSFAGTEIINVPRLVAYRNALAPTLALLDCSDCSNLQEALEDEPYTTPVLDEVDWYDPDQTGSDGFLGFMPTEIAGLTDSTRTAGVLQSTFDGGTVGRTRRATRDVRVSGWLIGTSVAAAEAGFTWLKSALNGGNCTDCEPGDDLCFMIACPATPTEADDFARHLRRVTCVDGPTVLNRRNLSSCGGHMIQVEFALVAASPYVFSEPVVVASASGGTLDTHIEGAEVFPMTEPLRNCLVNDAVGSGGLSSIIRDPDCPVIPNPPTAPLLSSSCKPQTFNSYAYVTSTSTTKAPVQTDSVTVAASGAYEARPSIAFDGTTLRVIYSESPTGTNNAASVVRTRTSTNNGATWSGATTVYDEGSGTKGSEPAALRWVESKSKFVMVTLEFDTAISGSIGKFRGKVHTSTTGAAGTWTDVDAGAVHALMAAKTFQYYLVSDLIHYDNGTTDGVLYLSAYGRRSTDSKDVVAIMRSLDFGVTWSWVGIPHPIGVTQFQWPTLAMFPDGELGVAAYVPTTTPSLYYMKTTNAGQSWSYPKVIVTKAKPKSKMWVTRDQTIMIMYSDQTIPGSRGMGRTGFAYSFNRGVSWGDTAATINGVKSRNWSGSVAGFAGGDWAELANGDLASVYASDYTNTNANVFFRRWTQVEKFLSYAMYVPDSALKTWSDGVINLQIKTGAKPTRQMRVRLIPRPIEGQMPEDLDPCSICGSFIIDYAPANTVVYIDGMTERITMRVGTGKPLPASHLVSGLNGGLFQWPTLTCGTGYFVLVDVDVDTIVDMALGVVNRE